MKTTLKNMIKLIHLMAQEENEEILQNNKKQIWEQREIVMQHLLMR